MPTEPRTEAGKALLADGVAWHMSRRDDKGPKALLTQILAIENEAAAGYGAQPLDAALDRFADFIHYHYGVAVPLADVREDVRKFLAYAQAAAGYGLVERLDFDAMRMAREWPTPNHMRTVADALDLITPAKYGDVLRWFADRCDEWVYSVRAAAVGQTVPRPRPGG